MLPREQKYAGACLYFGFKHLSFLHDVSMMMSENLLLQVFSARLKDARDVRFRKGTQIFVEITLISTHELYRKADLE